MRKRTIPACIGLAAAGATSLTLATGASANEAPRTTAATKKPLKVKVTAADFSFKLSKSRFKVGDVVVFTLVNKGPSPHDWDLEGTKGTPVIASGKTTKIKVTFKKAGTFRYVCTVPRHAQFGMDATLRVTK